MKLSFSTLGCPSWSLERVIDAAGRHGYDGIELRFLEDQDALWERPELSGTGVAETRRRLRDAGLAVPCVDSRSFFHHPDESARAQIASKRPSDRRARARAGCAGHPRVRRLRPARRGPRLDPGLDRRFPVDTRGAARPAGVEVWLESHGDFARATDTLASSKASAGRGVGVLWDRAQRLRRGRGPERRRAPARPPDPPRAPQGRARARKGTLPCPCCRGRESSRPPPPWRLLARNGYDGWLSFEWEKKWHPEIEEPEVALPHFVRWISALRRGTEPASSGARGALTAAGSRSRSIPTGAPGRGRGPRRGGAPSRSDRQPGDAPPPSSPPLRRRTSSSLRSGPSPDSRGSGSRPSTSTSTSASGREHPASFRRFLRDRLFAHVEVGAFHGLDGSAADPAEECRALRGPAPPGIADARDPGHRRERAPCLHRPAGLRFRRPRRRARGGARRAVPPTTGQRRRIREPRGRAPHRAFADHPASSGRSPRGGDRARAGETRRHRRGPRRPRDAAPARPRS